jgi:hypothetical protein
MLPDLKRIMFHPTGLRVNLGMFLLVRSDNFSGMVKEHATGAGGTLVDGTNVLSHIYLP